MPVYCDYITDISIGTAKGKTQLSGTVGGTTGSDYQIPTSARGIIAVEPLLYLGTPAANDAVVATLKIESSDAVSPPIGNYEVYAHPISGMTTVSASTIATGVMYQAPDSTRNVIYPWYLPVLGGEKFQFYGILQSAVSSTAFMGATIYWTDSPADLKDIQYQARISGTPGAQGGLTATGTATGSVSATNPITLSGQPLRTIREIFGVVAGTTPASAKPIAGFVTLTASEINLILRGGIDPIASPGSSLTPSPGKLFRKLGLSVPIQPPSQITPAIFFTAAPTTSGVFGAGILFN